MSKHVITVSISIVVWLVYFGSFRSAMLADSTPTTTVTTTPTIQLPLTAALEQNVSFK